MVHCRLPTRAVCTPVRHTFDYKIQVSVLLFTNEILERTYAGPPAKTAGSAPQTAGSALLTALLTLTYKHIHQYTRTHTKTQTHTLVK